MKPFLPAVLLFLLIVSVAPAIGHVRDLIFETFPKNGVRLLAVGFAGVAAGLFVFAVVRIRTHRFLRYSALVAVLGLLWVQTVGLGTHQAQVNVVEKVHVIEYGLLAFLLYRALLLRGSGAGSPVLLGLAFFGVALAGIAEESVQYLVPQRIGDVRDIALNLTAGVSGLLFALCVLPPSSWSWRLGEQGRRLAPRGTAIIVLALGLFFYKAHLGYEVQDPEIGRFLSRFTAEELLQISARRREAWGRQPPTGLETWGVEDYFLTEAAWHANHRNAAYKGGIFTHAWLANRILEKYYEPFLDIESFRGSGRHRYPPPRRQELEEKKGGHNPRTYLSPVAVGRLYAWPRPLFLAGLGAVVLLLWVSPRRFRS